MDGGYRIEQCEYKQHDDKDAAVAATDDGDDDDGARPLANHT